MVQIGYNVLKRTIREVNKLLINGETTVKKIYEDSSRLIEDTKKLNSFITVCDKSLLGQAEALDEILKHGNPSRGPTKSLLFGIPVSIKDNFCTDQILTTCGSRMLHNFIPNYTATAVSKLIGADCLMMGKTNMDEFAMGSSSLTSYYGPTANFWKSSGLLSPPKRKVLDDDGPILDDHKWFMAGGSSTGSAVSVASNACFISLGTDTGGSTRQPASLTGVIGFKPTYGLISRFGLIPLAHCMDVVSILARCVDDVVIAFDILVGMDENDMTSIDHRKHLKRKISTISTNSSNMKVLTIGIPDEFIANGKLSSDSSTGFDGVMQRLKQIGNPKINFVSLDLSYSKLATECYSVISSAEIASNMSCYDGIKYGHSIVSDPLEPFNRDKFFKANRDEAFGSEVKKRILLGNYFLQSGQREKYFTQALKLRRCIYEEFEEAFTKVDLIMTPSSPSASVSYGQWNQKQADNMLFHEDYFLIPANLANVPSISIPYGLSSEGLPLGLQLIGNRYYDLDLLSASSLFEDIFSE